MSLKKKGEKEKGKGKEKAKKVEVLLNWRERLQHTQRDKVM